jgi:hypothetical protein
VSWFGCWGVCPEVIGRTTITSDRVTPIVNNREAARVTTCPFPCGQTQAFARIIAAVVEIALGDDPKGADRGEHPAFSAVDLVHAIGLSHWPTLTAAWQIEVLNENVSRIALVIAVALIRATAAAEDAIPRVAAVSPFVGPRIVSVEHDPLHHVER